MTSDVWVLGGFQTDFARHYTREGLDIADLTHEVVEGTLQASGVGGRDIGVIHVGNAFGQLFTGQGHLGAMPATVHEGLWGVPASRHEAACASGSVAVLSAMAEIEAGRYDVALVVGVELERTVPGDEAARLLGAAAWVGHEAQDAQFVWPAMFSDLADEYDRRYGLDQAAPRRDRPTNFANAKRNPHRPDPRVGLRRTLARRHGQPGRRGPGQAPGLQPDHRRRGRRRARERRLATGPPRSTRRLARITGWGHRTVGLGLRQKLDHDREDPYVLPHVRRAVLDAFDRAGRVDSTMSPASRPTTASPRASTWPSTTSGLTAPGESWKAIENGDLELGGAFPINPSGGLIGGGHPVGATGVRMLLDATKQVTGTAGDYQVEGADTFATLNIGGSTATTVSLVVTGLG